MRYIKLVRGEGYGPIFDMTFWYDQPMQVTEEQFEYLISLGKFREVIVALPLEEEDAPSVLLPDEEDGVPYNAYDGILAEVPRPVKQPQNLLGLDNLNDKKVMFRRNGAIGDTLFVIQFAAYIKNEYPKCAITIAVTPTLLEFVAQFTCVDNVITLEDSCRHDTVYQYDYIIPFSGVIEDHVVQTDNYYKLHFIAAGKQWDDSIVMPLLQRKPMLQGVKEKAAAIRTHFDLIHQDYTVILPNTGSPLRSINFSTLQKIGDNIAAGIGMDTGRRIVYITSEDDERPYKVIEGRASVIKEQNLGVVSELLSSAACVIGGDTGLTHYASALGVPTVSLWTCTDSDNILSSMPHSERATAIRAQIECSPCCNPRSAYCKAFSGNTAACTERIPYDEVVTAVNAHLRSAGEYAAHSIVDVKVNTPDVLTVENALPKIDGSFVEVAIPIAMTNMYTGGGFYCWYLARSIAAHRNMRVWVLADSTSPVFFNGASQVPDRFNVVYDPAYKLLFGENKAKFSFVIGQPQAEGLAAVRYAKENEGARALCILYETPGYIRKYRGGQDAQESFWADYKHAVEDADCCFVVSRTVKEEVLKWIPSFEDRKSFLKVVQPIVDDAACDSALPLMKTGSYDRLLTASKSNSVVLCSRNVNYKQMQRTVDLLIEKFAPHHSTLENPFTINIIGAKASTIARKHNTADLAARAITVVAHENCPEDKKWKLIGEAKALLHPSEFEGFGIPVAEALLACTPVVAHPLPVFKQAFLDHPYYYTDDDSMLATMHHIWNAWSSTPGDYSSLSKLQRYIFKGYDFARTRFRAYIRDARLNTVFELHWDDTRKINAERLLTKQSGETARVALVSPWNTCATAADISKVIADNVRCTFRVFAPEVSRGLLFADGKNVTRCYNREFNTGALLSEVNAYAPDIVHITLNGTYPSTAQVNIIKFMQDVKTWGIPVVATVDGLNDDSGFYKDVCTEAAAVVMYSRRKTVSATPAFVIAPPCAITSNVDKVDARKALGIDEYSFVVGLFGAHHIDAEIQAVTDSYKEVSGNVPTKTEYILHSVGNDKSIALSDARASNKNMHVFTKYISPAAFTERTAACDVLVACSLTDHPTDGTSGILRMLMAAHRPVIAVGTHKFDGVPTGSILRVTSTELHKCSADLACKIVDLSNSKKDRDEMVAAASNYVIASQVSAFTTKISDVYKKTIATAASQSVSS